MKYPKLVPLHTWAGIRTHNFEGFITTRRRRIFRFLAEQLLPTNDFSSLTDLFYYLGDPWALLLDISLLHPRVPPRPHLF
jgi:hypothetical protein